MRGVDGRLRLVQRTHGFGQEQVDTVGQGPDHLPVLAEQFVVAGVGGRVVAVAEGWQRRGDHHVTVGGVGRLPGQPARQAGEFVRTVPEAGRFEAVGERGVRVGREHVHAGGDVVGVDRRDQPGVVEQGPGRPHRRRRLGSPPDQLLAHATVEEYRCVHGRLSIVG